MYYRIFYDLTLVISPLTKMKLKSMNKKMWHDDKLETILGQRLLELEYFLFQDLSIKYWRIPNTSQDTEIMIIMTSDMARKIPNSSYSSNMKKKCG